MSAATPLHQQRLALPNEQALQRHQPLLLPFLRAITALQTKSRSDTTPPFRLCVVGGGYICHALSCVLQPLLSAGLLELTVLSDDLQAALQNHDSDTRSADATPQPHITCTFTPFQRRPPVQGAPSRVSSYAKDVIPQADMILLTVLASQRIDVLQTLLPLIDTKRVVMLGSVNGGGGFDLVALRLVHRYYKQHPVAAGRDKTTNSNLVLFGFQDQPYLCSKLV